MLCWLRSLCYRRAKVGTTSVSPGALVLFLCILPPAWVVLVTALCCTVLRLCLVKETDSRASSSADLTWLSKVLSFFISE